MTFRLVTDEELDQVRNLDGAATAIRRKLKALVEYLGKQFNGDDPGGISGVEFAYLESGRAIATVKTRFGIGRMRLTWVQDGKQLLGEVIIDRQVFDQRDQEAWEPVYSFFLGEQGGWMPRNKSANPPNYLAGDQETKCWALGASIAFAILKGPVRD
jgi:hypothetical protein